MSARRWIRWAARWWRRSLAATLLLPILLLFAAGAAAGAQANGHSQASVVRLFATYQPHAKQVEFHKSTARFKVLLAGRRSGKTWAAAREFLRRVYQDLADANRRGERWDPRLLDFETGEPTPLLHYWCVAPTYDLSKIQQREVFRLLSPHRRQLILKWRRTEKALWLRGGILIEFKSANNPDKLVGTGLNGLWCDEAARLKQEAWSGNISPTLADKLGWALFSTTPLGRNWFDDEIVRQADPTDEKYAGRAWALFHFTTADNTALPHLVEEVERARKTMPWRYFAREYLASRDAFAGQIYDMFQRVYPAQRDGGTPHPLAGQPCHVVPARRGPGGEMLVSLDGTTWGPLPRIVRLVAGKDWGYSDNHPGITALFGIDAQGNWWGLEELRRVHLEVVSDNPAQETWVKLDKALLAKWRTVARNAPVVMYVPPDRPDHRAVYRRHGLPVQLADDDVDLGIQAVATLLHVPDAGAGAPRLRFLSFITAGIREIEGYAWEEGKERPRKERPRKENDHYPDAARYAVRSETKPPAGRVVRKHPGWQ